MCNYSNSTRGTLVRWRTVGYRNRTAVTTTDEREGFREKKKLVTYSYVSLIETVANERLTVASSVESRVNCEEYCNLRRCILVGQCLFSGSAGWRRDA